jgi:hypothetical protein
MLVSRRDRALIATMTCTFARVSAAIGILASFDLAKMAAISSKSAMAIVRKRLLGELRSLLVAT